MAVERARTPYGGFFESPMLDSGSGPAFREGGEGTPQGSPVLVGGRCRCGHTFVPFQTFGCEVCGEHGDRISEVLLEGSGRLRALAIVRRHPHPTPPTPFTVVAVELRDGLIVRALRDPADRSELRIGDPLAAVVLDVQDGTGQVGRQLHFRRAGDGV